MVVLSQEQSGLIDRARVEAEPNGSSQHGLGRIEQKTGWAERRRCGQKLLEGSDPDLRGGIEAVAE